MVLAVLALGMAMSSNAQTQEESASYFLFLKDDGMTWCGFRNSDEFQNEAKQLAPSESARVTFAGNRLLDVTYQLNEEKGAWVVVDKYVFVGDGVVVHRENLLKQQGGLRVTQETSIRQGTIEPFRVIDASGSGKREVDVAAVKFPPVEVKANPSELPFMPVITDMQTHSLATLCK
jgi:hypothetical protein